MTNQDELSTLIDHQKTSGEALSECFLKAEALINVALSCDFLDYPESTVHSYLWVLSDIVEKAKKLNEESLGLLKSILHEINVSMTTLMHNDAPQFILLHQCGAIVMHLASHLMQ